MTWQVGDKVRIKAAEKTPNVGCEGVIIYFEVGTSFPYGVRLTVNDAIIIDNYNDAELEQP